MMVVGFLVVEFVMSVVVGGDMLVLVFLLAQSESQKIKMLADNATDAIRLPVGRAFNLACFERPRQ